jgi:hypothetical protein
MRVRRLHTLVTKELSFSQKVPLGKRIGGWRRGFLSESGMLYGGNGHDLSDYLSDWSRFIRTCGLRDDWCFLLDDKLLFYAVFKGVLPLPSLIGLIVEGRLCRLHADAPGTLPELIRANGGIAVLKPRAGSMGLGVLVIRETDGWWNVNHRAMGETELHELARSLDGYLVQQFVHQGRYSSAIYPDAVNTVRLVTMLDPDTEEPFAAASVHRFGTSQSAPADNWSRGGLSARVDVQTGRLGEAVTCPSDGTCRYHARHPESGAAIAGVMVPDWEQIVEGVLHALKCIPLLPYVGWDIVVTNSGFMILEGNSNTDVNLLQVHQPLLADERVRRSYRKMGVVR